MRNDTPRNIVRSRTTMSHAFEAAIYDLIRREGSMNSGQGTIATWAAQCIDRATKKASTWTVSKKDRRR